MPPADPDGPTLRVALVDDHELFRDGMRAWMTNESTRIAVVASAATVAALDLTTGPDVVLLDLDLRDGSVLESNIATILAAGAAVLMVSSFDDRVSVRRAMRAGAAGYAAKRASAAELAELVLTVGEGGTGMSRELALALLDDVEPVRPHLSPREEEVLRLYAGGMAQKSVAARLGIAGGTVKAHVDRIRKKYADLGRPAYTKVELHRVAREDGRLDL